MVGKYITKGITTKSLCISSIDTIFPLNNLKLLLVEFMYKETKECKPDCIQSKEQVFNSCSSNIKLSEDVP